jgi:two-component system response regulator YesN
MKNQESENPMLQKPKVVELILKEQLLKEYIIGSKNDLFELYKDMFDISERTNVTMAIVKPDKALDYSDLNYLKSVINKEIGEKKLLLCTALTDIVLVVTLLSSSEIISCIQRIRRVKAFEDPIAAVYSNSKTIRELPDTYSKLVKCMDYCFYTKSGSGFIGEDIINSGVMGIIEPDCGAVERAVRCGDIDKVHYLIFEIFRDIEKYKPEPIIARTYCLELFVCIIRCCETERIGKYMKGLTLLQEMRTLFEMKEYILNTANEIVQSNSPQNGKRYSALIRDTLEIIEENIGNEHLTLSWIAGNVLYTNVDYLGKVFKRETGKNFSTYVMEKRMEIAKSLIIGDKKDKIYEVAEKVGFGSNSQYFSQVFKRYTGVSPVAYKEISKVSCNG